MRPAYICKYCLESESEHASYGEWCPRYSEDGHFTAWDKSHKFERVAVKELLLQSNIYKGAVEQLKQLKERNLELADELVQANQKLISYSGEVEQLKEERKELVEALKQRIEWCKHSKADAEKYNDWFKPEVMAMQEIDALESILSKVKQ